MHRRLGLLGAALAALIVIIGAIVALRAAAAHNGPLNLFDVVNLLLFACFVASALVLRNRADYHKRLMLLATLTILWPAIARITSRLVPDNLVVPLLVLDLCVLVCIVVDALRYRRLHPAFGWGALLTAASFHLTYFAAHTRTWILIATSLAS